MTMLGPHVEREFYNRVESIPAEIAWLQRTVVGRAMLSSIGGYGTHDNATLLNRISTSENPVVLWACHALLTRRGIPPCLRPESQANLVLAFVTWLADLHWLACKHQDHRPFFETWDCLIRHPRPGSCDWHQRAVFKYGRGRHPGYFVAGLGLTPEQQREMAYICMASIRKERYSRKRCADIYERLLAHARRNPDRLGRRTPEEMAARRLRLLEVFVLAGKSPGRTVHYLQLTGGETLTRQALMKQIKVARGITRIGLTA